MKEQLEAKGWKMYYECIRCGHKQYFNNPAFKKYEIRVKPKRKTFTIHLENHLVGGPFYYYQLEEQLKKFGIN